MAALSVHRLCDIGTISRPCKLERKASESARLAATPPAIITLSTPYFFIAALPFLIGKSRIPPFPPCLAQFF